MAENKKVAFSTVCISCSLKKMSWKNIGSVKNPNTIRSFGAEVKGWIWRQIVQQQCKMNLLLNFVRWYLWSIEIKSVYVRALSQWQLISNQFKMYLLKKWILTKRPFFVELIIEKGIFFCEESTFQVHTSTYVDFFSGKK